MLAHKCTIKEIFLQRASLHRVGKFFFSIAMLAFAGVSNAPLKTTYAGASEMRQQKSFFPARPTRHYWHCMLTHYTRH